MHLNQEQLIELCETAKSSAIEASKVIQSYFGKDIEVLKKEGGSNSANSVLTQADLESQKIILQILYPTIKKYDLGLLAEEENDDGSRFEKDYFWCIDPLDGTLNFSQKKEGYSLSIALVSQKGEAIIGVVMNPSTNNLYHAIKGHGAFKNDHFLKIEAKSKDVTIPTDQGAVMNAIDTIEKAPAIYCKPPKKSQGGGSLWDFAATSIIQSEAGGYNSDYYKQKLKLNNKNTFMNKYGIIYASSEDLLKS